MPIPLPALLPSREREARLPALRELRAKLRQPDVRYGGRVDPLPSRAPGFPDVLSIELTEARPGSPGHPLPSLPGRGRR